MPDIGLEPIPVPPGLPFLGNVRDIDPISPAQSINKLADQYGDIIKLEMPNNRSIVVVSSQALVNECCDESRFTKALGNGLREVRNATHDGLFTAEMSEPNWGIAHRVLTPAFGPMPIAGMFDEMHDIGTQLALKWARYGAEPISVTEDFTRLTLDTLALCAMDYRFNSFYRSDMHPFVQAMVDFLIESGNRGRRVLPDFMYRAVDQKYQADIEILRSTADGVLHARKEQKPPSQRKDLLGAMLNGKDPRTGAYLSDDAITSNLVTFLIAGHETTSGLLSFSLYNFLRHPETFAAAQKEVDDVVGTGPVTPEHLPKLRYMAAFLRECLRVTATIPAVTIAPLKDELLGGKYFVPAGQRIMLLFMRSHLDPRVFGDDAREFRPERMSDENFERLNREFPNCWKPFGNGARACIGRPFAWQESLIVLAMLLQNFTFAWDDPAYELSLKESLTIKPADFQVRAHLREGLTPTILEQRLSGGASAARRKAAMHADVAVAAPGTGMPLDIYYGSNSGTCEALAGRLAADAPSHGFRADLVQPLDTAVQALPTDRPVVLITASYEGEAPDNAAQFVAWIKGLPARKAGSDEPAALADVAYAVFGCGNHDWSRTFHRIPKLVDSTLAACGAAPIVPLGVTDTAEGNVFEDFEAWEDTVLFPGLRAKYGTAAPTDGAAAAVHPESGLLQVEVTTPRTSALRQDVREAQVVAVRALTGDDSRDAASGAASRKRHMEIELPADMTYRAGDYLAVLPFNGRKNIERALRRFHLPWDANITVKDSSAAASAQTNLPANLPISAYEVLGAYYDLAQQATKRGITVLSEASKSEESKAALQSLANDDYAAEISAKRVSILDLLERFPDIALPFGTFLSLLPPMRVRQYSISSSPLWNPHRATLTYSVLSAPAISGSGIYEGVASNYLASLAPGDTVHVAVRPSHNAFHLPDDVENVPLILIAAGSGLAPFRGFVQERAAMLGAGRAIAPALLFFGCRSSADDLYPEELSAWEKSGAVSVRRAYSRVSAADANVSDAVAAQSSHVQDRMYHDREDVLDLWQRGAVVYVCGSRRVANGVKDVFLKIHREDLASKGTEESEDESEAWFESLRNVRYAIDVFD